ncbi:Uncharacterised protein [Chlamydia abortus]|nr:Uncharacterised protein [Chlamydia abortus]SGA31741.1 Uncharacterised protein [Chlamydia abortus]
MKLINQIDNQKNEDVLLKAIFEEDKLPTNLVKKQGYITEFLSDKLAYIYLGKKEELKYDSLYSLAVSLIDKVARNYQIDLASFVTESLTLNEVIDALTKGINFSAFEY